MEGGNGIRNPRSHQQQDLEACAITKRSQVYYLQIDLLDQVQCGWTSGVLQSQTHDVGISSKRR